MALNQPKAFSTRGCSSRLQTANQRRRCISPAAALLADFGLVSPVWQSLDSATLHLLLLLSSGPHLIAGTWRLAHTKGICPLAKVGAGKIKASQRLLRVRLGNRSSSEAQCLVIGCLCGIDCSETPKSLPCPACDGSRGARGFRLRVWAGWAPRLTPAT